MSQAEIDQETAAKLSDIFLPHASKLRLAAIQRQTKVGAEPPKHLRFAHYTSAEAALSIIKSRRIWMRNSTCMSDRSEVQHGADILNKFFQDAGNRTSFVTELDKCFPGAATEAMAAVHNWQRDIRLETYITCVSEHRDEEDQNGRLSMWRAFGESSPRVALVFRLPLGAEKLAGSLRLIFNPVFYLSTEEAHATVREAIGNVRTNCAFLQTIDRQLFVGMIFVMLQVGMTCLKHDGFREECEWRAIYSPSRSPSSLMESSIELVKGVPQIIYKIPLDKSVSADLSELDFSAVFDRIIIGPSPYPWVLHRAFSTLLKEMAV